MKKLAITLTGLLLCTSCLATSTLTCYFPNQSPLVKTGTLDAVKDGTFVFTASSKTGYYPITSCYVEKGYYD